FVVHGFAAHQRDGGEDRVNRERDVRQFDHQYGGPELGIAAARDGLHGVVDHRHGDALVDFDAFLGLSDGFAGVAIDEHGLALGGDSQFGVGVARFEEEVTNGDVGEVAAA